MAKPMECTQSLRNNFTSVLEDDKTREQSYVRKIKLESENDDSVPDPNYQPNASLHNYFDENIAATSKDIVQTGTNQSPDTSSFTNLESKKRNCRTRQQRATSKRLRNSGQRYVTELGKFVAERSMKELNPCRLKCAERFTDEDRLKCFNEYWKLGNRDKRATYISGLMTILPKKTQKTDTVLINRECYCKYKLIIGNETNPICKECFCKTFAETKGFISVVMEKKKLSKTGVILPDGRGLQPPKNKRTADEILTTKAHILSFPSYESHYCRRSTNKKYLSSELSIAMMYRLYKETCSKPVSLNLYAKCFHDLKLAFKPPPKDTCHKCNLLNTELKLTDSEENLQLFKNELNEHQILAEKAHDAKKKDKYIAKSNTRIRTYSFDLQQCLPTPYLKTPASFYKRQLWSFNLTVHDMANNDATCYMWDETIGGRGANNIASCLYHLLKRLPLEVKEVTFYSDTCGGQNKNNIVAMMFMFLLNKHPTLKIINHKFIVSGHTPMECDSDHAIIEMVKKKTTMKINHLNDWIQLVRSCNVKKSFEVVVMSLDDFYNFSDLSKKGPFTIKTKNSCGNKFLWQPIQWLQYRKDSFGEIFFKENLDDDTPFKVINFNKLDRSSIETVEVNIISKESLPISKEKKKDILDILSLIDPPFHDFYKNLKTNDAKSRDPDLDIDDPDEDSEGKTL